MAVEMNMRTYTIPLLAAATLLQPLKIFTASHARRSITLHPSVNMQFVGSGAAPGLTIAAGAFITFNRVEDGCNFSADVWAPLGVAGTVEVLEIFDE